MSASKRMINENTKNKATIAQNVLYVLAMVFNIYIHSYILLTIIN